MNPRIPLTLLCAALLSLQGFGAPKRPNIVLFLADDMGYGNLACYGAGQDIATPNIDRLAGEGLRFTDAHAPASVCQPTRYALLSGRYYWRSGWGRIQSGIYFRENEVLFPKLLQQAGYATAMFGKWHMGFGLTVNRQPTDWNAELKPGPLECGFDTWFGMPNAHNQPPFVFIENHWVYKNDPNDPVRVLTKEEAANDKNATDWGGSSGGKAAHEACPRERLDLVIAERACQFIAAQTPEKPFFLYVPFFAPHVPLSVAKEFQGKSPIGQRLRRTNNAVRTAEMVQQLDHAVGTVMAALKQHGFDDNTLIVFSSDNGNLNLGDNQAVGFRTNGIFNGQKADTWEGGHRVPCIVRWNGRVPAGATTDKLFSLADLYRTFLAAADVPVPAGAAPDSLDLLPLLEKPESAPGRAIMTYKGKAMALRVGDWSFYPYQGTGGLFSKGPCVELGYTHSDYDAQGNPKPGAPAGQLYNLRKDPSQTTNLYEKEPELVAAMAAIFEKATADAKKDVPLETYLGELAPEIAKKLNPSL